MKSITRRIVLGILWGAAVVVTSVAAVYANAGLYAVSLVLAETLNHSWTAYILAGPLIAFPPTAVWFIKGGLSVRT